MTRAMVGLQGLHSSDTFHCSNISTNVGLKSFCTWCLKLRGNTKTIVIHLTEVHYHLAIVFTFARHLPVCHHKPSLSTTLDVRSSHTKRSPRQKSRKKLIKANPTESCRVKGCPRPSIQSCWWMWVDLVIWTSYCEGASTQSYKLSYFCFPNTIMVLWDIMFILWLIKSSKYKQ